VRAALQDAASVAGLLITTEAMVAEVPKKNRRRRPAAAADPRLRPNEAPRKAAPGANETGISPRSTA
jgi:hypothetical protein